jgi:tetratricopeptide (TPR) repeat protein
LKNNIHTYCLILFVVSASFAGYTKLHAQTDPPPVPQTRLQPQNQRSAQEQLGLQYYRSKEFVKAREIFEQLYEESPRRFYYNYLLMCYLNLEEYKQADKLIKKQSRKDPTNYQYKIDQAYLLKITGNEKKSDKILKSIVNDLPQNKNAIIQIASSLQSKGYFEEALQVYENAKKRQAAEYSYNYELATAFQYTGDYDKMFGALLEHVKANPGDVQRVKNRMQSLIRHDVDDNLSGLLKSKLLESAQSNPEVLIYAELLLWYSMQTKDFDMAYRQARAIDLRFQEKDEDMLELASIAFANKQYELAAKAYEYVKDKGESSPYFYDSYTGYYVSLLEEAKADPGTTIKQYKNLEKSGKKALEDMGLNPFSVEVVTGLSHIIAFELGNYTEAKDLLEEAITIPNLTAEKASNLKLELADILLFTDNVWDATLLYSQIENDMKNEPVGHEAKFRNARLFYVIGEYSWAQTKLDVLKSATSKLIANDALDLSLLIKDLVGDDTLGFIVKMFGKADMLTYRGKYDSALIWYEKIEGDRLGRNSFQHLVYRKAGMMVKKQDYQTADSLYAYLAEQFPDGIKADNALFARAEIQRTIFENEDTAKSLYMLLMKDYPESIYAGEARLQFRAMRKGEEEIEL